MQHSPTLRATTLAAILASFALAPGAANAATAAATGEVEAGSLTFVNSTPEAVEFPTVTLNGEDQTVVKKQVIDILDATGSGAGWRMTATSTTFTDGAKTLPNTAVTFNTVPDVACQPTKVCVTPTNSIGAIYNLPADTVAPAATTFFNAAAATGTGNVRVEPTWRLTVPATALVGTYSSTWTISLVSGPS